jgi:hypothetical protein
MPHSLDSELVTDPGCVPQAPRGHRNVRNMSSWSDAMSSESPCDVTVNVTPTDILPENRSSPVEDLKHE